MGLAKIGSWCRVWTFHAIPSKVILLNWPQTAIEWELTQMNFLCKPGISCNSKQINIDVIPAPPPVGGKVWKRYFLYRSGNFMWYQAKLDPKPIKTTGASPSPPVSVGKNEKCMSLYQFPQIFQEELTPTPMWDNFSLQIWTFHAIPSKNISSSEWYPLYRSFLKPPF